MICFNKICQISIRPIKKNKINTAEYQEFKSYESAQKYVSSISEFVGDISIEEEVEVFS